MHSERTRLTAMSGWFRKNYGNPTDEHHAAASRLDIDLQRQDSLDIDLCDTGTFAHAQQAYRFANGDPGQRAFAAMPTIRSALSSTSAATGGAIASPSMMVEIIERSLLAFGGILAAADVIRTDHRGDLIFPRVSDTGNTGRRLPEGGAITSATLPSFGQMILRPYKYCSDSLLIPNEMMLDGTVVDMAAFVATILGERIARGFGAHCITGTGASQPHGIIPAATTTVSAASATSISHDDIDNLVAAVDPDYRIGASFLMHDNTRLALRKAKDGEGQRIWPEGVETLRGYPVVIASAMDSTLASGAKSVAFGNLKKYKIRMRPQFRISRLVEKHQLEDQTGFIAFAELDGGLLDTAAVKVLLH